MRIKRMLQDRQLIGIVAHVVQEPLHEHRRDPWRRRRRSASRSRPASDRAAAGDQVLTFIHRFGQAGDLGTVAQIVGAHRDSDVDRAFRLLAGGQQQVHKGGGRFLGIDALLPEAEQLLELVDDDQQVGLGSNSSDCFIASTRPKRLRLSVASKRGSVLGSSGS